MLHTGEGISSLHFSTTFSRSHLEKRGKFSDVSISLQILKANQGNSWTLFVCPPQSDRRPLVPVVFFPDTGDLIQ